jgi:hypothetical protein
MFSSAAVRMPTVTAQAYYVYMVTAQMYNVHNVSTQQTSRNTLICSRNFPAFYDT